ncbi:MAG: alpha-L-fucosidase [Opitutales bacterium]
MIRSVYSNFLIGLCVAAAPSLFATEERSLEQQMTDFRDLDFGMFIHFNMATYLGVEWVAGYHSPADFAPDVETIDTDAWAEAAQAAGMTYAVLTTKHVSGFCLWDSKYTTYDVMHPDCPYQKDLVAQFVKSFTERGLKVGLYYCWRHPGFDDKYKVLPPECDPAKNDRAAQIEFQKKQIAELIEKYPEAFYIWNDALDSEMMTSEEATEFYRSFDRELLASSNWWNWGKKGTKFIDIPVKELRHFKEELPTPGETCWKIERPGWFWSEKTRTVRAENILQQMKKAQSLNSNFLLNVAPDRNGQIIPSSVEALKKIGEIRKQNGL